MPNNPRVWQLMKPHFSRLWHGVKTFDISDISHAIVNIPVEFCRADPYRAGHWYVYQVIILAGYIGYVLWIR